MTDVETAKFLVELHSAYFDLACRYGQTCVPEYAEAVAKAIMSIAGRNE